MKNQGKNLLILTQKVNKNDSNLGFFHNWILEFSKHCQKLTVICLEKGEYNLPSNVKVLSLGKEQNISKFRYLVNFYKYIWQERNHYDNVFVHMNVEYIILGGLLWKSWGKKVSLWYMHKSVTSKLKWAEKLTDIIFTGSKDSFRLKTKKLQILHHGIDGELFSFKDKEIKKILNIVTVGRISESKNIDLMIEIIADLKNKTGSEPVLKIIGDTIYKKDKSYLEFLKNKVKKLNLQNINFVGSIANINLPKFYQDADIFLNFSDTGSLDKAILEALSCGTLVISSNDSAKEFLPQELFVENKNVESISNKIINLTDRENTELKKGLNLFVREKHNLNELVIKILKQIEL